MIAAEFCQGQSRDVDTPERARLRFDRTDDGSPNHGSVSDGDNHARCRSLCLQPRLDGRVDRNRWTACIRR
jgi:hypothetical protein